MAIDVTYASRHLRLPAGALGGDRLVLIGAVPARPRAMLLFAQEGGRWILSLGGYGDEDRPPDLDAYAAFAATVAPRDVAEAIDAAEPLDEVVTYALPGERAAPVRATAPLPGGAAGRSATRSAPSTRRTARA